MRELIRSLSAVLTCLLLLMPGVGACRSAAPVQGIYLEKIKIPPGFRIDLYADGVANARSMALSPNGVLYVGTRRGGKLYAVQDSNGDQRADNVRILADGLNMPNGVAYRDGSLYVAEVNRVLRYDDMDNRLDSPPRPVVVSSRFPSETHHGWKYIAFGPDGWLYVPVGAPCNVCEKGDERFSTIMRMKPDGRDLEDNDLANAIQETVPLYETYEERIKELRNWARGRARPATLDVKMVDLFETS